MRQLVLTGVHYLPCGTAYCSLTFAPSGLFGGVMEERQPPNLDSKVGRRLPSCRYAALGTTLHAAQTAVHSLPRCNLSTTSQPGLHTQTDLERWFVEGPARLLQVCSSAPGLRLRTRFLNDCLHGPVVCFAAAVVVGAGCGAWSSRCVHGQDLCVLWCAVQPVP